ncbi:DUF6887 family protein [Leptolyngbya sp. AN03gr2]|uniref:DUF6887 family protein n=1 Tax=unclassified Leptolyngbya TaxID=2650499 RepID=UPI003D31A71F
MKPNFEVMTTRELKDYVLTHREDLDAIDALVSRRSPDSEAILFDPPKSVEEVQQQFERYQQLMNDQEQKND